MNVVELLGRYMNWADRLVARRPRSVVTWDGFLRHGAAERHWDAVQALAAKIEAEEDLKPYLSDRVDRYGYVRPKPGLGSKPPGIEWDDKDYALNAYGTHHLHLRPKRTPELLYVSFSRHDAFFVMVGNHASFDDGALARAVAEARVGTSMEIKGVVGAAKKDSDRERNGLQRRGLSTVVGVGSSTVMGAMLSTAGTSPFHTRHADQMALEMARLDPHLDAPGFGRESFERGGKPYPSAPAWEWVLHYCDLLLRETSSGVHLPVVDWVR